MYVAAVAALKQAGLNQYEVSNFARAQRYQSIHNLNYWLGRDYIGTGPGFRFLFW
jgi:coproporphyrinogen III oxidase-like Fe-S oxidoreductase